MWVSFVLYDACLINNLDCIFLFLQIVMCYFDLAITSNADDFSEAIFLGEILAIKRSRRGLIVVEGERRLLIWTAVRTHFYLQLGSKNIIINDFPFIDLNSKTVRSFSWSTRKTQSTSVLLVGIDNLERFVLSELFFLAVLLVKWSTFETIYNCKMK